jgi:glycogen operon protein
MWFNPGGNEMSDEEWGSPFVRCLGMLLSGDSSDVFTFQGEPVRDDTFLFLINAHFEKVAFVMPGKEELEWELILDTANETGFLEKTKKFASGDDVDLADRSACLLKLSAGEPIRAREESWKKRHFEPPAVSAEEERAGKNSGKRRRAALSREAN